MLGVNRAAALAGLILALAACAPPPPIAAPPSPGPHLAAGGLDAVKPDCRRGPTPAQTEGPYFRPDSPERPDLGAGLPGTPISLAGYVLTAACRPIPGARLDFWQADDAGQYDNAGYQLRGHQFTNAAGRFFLQTVLPGIYPGRTRHLHVKVQAQASAEPLTTQLYFPGEEARNQADGLFDPRLTVEWAAGADSKLAVFNFVLEP